MKKYFIPLTIAFGFIVLGLFISIIDITKLNINEGLPCNYIKQEYTYTYDNNTKVYINNEHVEIISNEDVDETKVVVTYYPEYTKAEIVEINRDSEAKITTNKIASYKFNDVVKDIINNLKKNEIYNYSKLYTIRVTVYVNSEYRSNIKINR